MLSLLAGLALAAPLDGWEDSRWLVEIEETLPVQLPIAGPDTNPPVLRAVQLRGILHCPKFEMAGKKAAYVTCSFAELALQASPQSNPGDRMADYEAAMANLEQVLEAGTIEFKMRDDGRLAQTDFQPPAKADEFAREAALALTIDAIGGFSLFREDVPAGSPWDEKNSPMLRAATRPLGNGLTKIRHQPISHEGMALLQSAGEGTFTSEYISWGAGRVEQIRGSTAATVNGGGAARGAVAPMRTFDAAFSGVTVIGDGTGPFQERMWNLQSAPKADAMNATGNEETPLFAWGHIRRLKTDEKPDLGRSGLVSAPGAKFGELPVWTPLEGSGG